MNSPKHFLKRLSAVGMALALSVSLLAGCASNTPVALIEDGIKNLSENITDEYAVISNLSEAVNGGSIQVNIALDEIIKDAADINIDGVDGSLTMFFGEDSTMLNTAVRLNGVSVIDADVYMDKEGFAISSDAVFGKGVSYGSAYNGMDERFGNSIFAKGQKYGDYAGLIGIVVDYLAQTGNAFAMYDDLRDIFDEHKEEIYTAIEDNSDSSAEKGTYTAGNNTIKTRNVKIVAKEDQFINVTVAVIDVLLGSEDFRNFCNDHQGAIKDVFETDNLIETLEDFKTKANEKRGSLGGYELEIYASVSRRGRELVALEVKTKAPNEDDKSFKIEILPSSDELERISFAVNTGDTNAVYEYSVTENTKTSYRSRLTENKDGNTSTLFDYSWDKSSGDFKLKLNNDSYTVKGTITDGKKQSVINIFSIEGDGADYKFEKLEIIIKASDDMPPAIEDYKDIMTMSTEEFEAIIKDLEELYTEYLGN